MIDRLYMLDTDISSYLVKDRHLALRAKVESTPRTSICISAITRAEMLYGLNRLPAIHPQYLAGHRFLRMMETRSWDSDAADIYADIFHELKRTGMLFGIRDVMIAAHAIALGATLVTNNTRHFERIAPPLRLETWVAG